MSEVRKIRDAWQRAGEPYCEHDRVDKEYQFGADTEDYACLTCGESWSRGSDKPEPSGAKPSSA